MGETLKNMSTILQIRRGTAVEWTTANPILAQAEQGYETDGLGTESAKYKIGDGITDWNALPYQSTDVGLTGDDIITSEGGSTTVSEDILSNNENIGTNTTNLDSHVTDSNNPHQVTAEQVGLENVDNTSDADKEVSTATQSAIDSINGEVSNNTTNITDNSNNIQTNNTNISNHVGDSNNPHGVTSSQLGLENVDNTSDLEKPISNDTQGAIDEVSLTASDNATLIGTQGLEINENTAAIGTNTTNLDSHVTDIANPHSVTATQVGLENVDNTSDLDKPVSTDTQALADLKINYTDNPSATQTGGIRAVYTESSSTLIMSIDGVNIV
jgi:hypothetical protein